jgi:hypothetical protein
MILVRYCKHFFQQLSLLLLFSSMVNQNVIDLVMIVIVCYYTDLYYIYFNYCDRYFSLKDKNNTRLDFHLIQNSTGSVRCNTLVYVIHCQGSISHLEQTELISIAEWTSIFIQSTVKDHPIINHTDINVKVD